MKGSLKCPEGHVLCVRQEGNGIEHLKHTPVGCVLGVLQEGNGRGDTKHVKHAQTDMFDVFGVSGWVEEAPDTLNTPRWVCSMCSRGDVRWERHQAQQHAHLGLLSCLAGGAWLGCVQCVRGGT